MPIKELQSKQHENQLYTYWWDITPSHKNQILINQIEAFKFYKKDTEEYCIVSATDLINAKFLNDEVQSTRHIGNYGVKILHNNPNILVTDNIIGSDKRYEIVVQWDKDT